MNEFYCYIYFDPRTDEPFYIGKGKGYRGWDFKGHDHARNLTGRLRKLQKLNLLPIVRTQMQLTAKKALMMEKLLIAVFGRVCNGTGPLLNVSPGGDNPPSMKGRKQTPEHIEKRTGWMKGSPKHPMKSPELRERQRQNRLGKPAHPNVLKVLNQHSEKLRGSVAPKISCVLCRQVVTYNTVPSHYKRAHSLRS